MAKPGSRGFLLILLLVTVTCIVVVQVSMDGWIRKGGSISDEDSVHSDQKFMQPLLVGTQSTTASVHSYNSDQTTRTISVASENLPTNKTVETIRFKQKASNNYAQSVQVKTKVSGSMPGLLRSKQKRPPFSIGDRHLRFKNSALAALQKVPVVDPKNVTNVLLLAYFRSGSSFTGELLQQNWKTFYQFEPLHYMTYDSRIPDNRTNEAFDLFRGIYTCNFTGQDKYFEWVRHLRNQFLFSRSMFLWFYCRIEPRLCFSSEFVSAVCQRAPVRLSKVTRVSMRQLRTFMSENRDLDLKVVYLTRDPRGILSSRWSLDWCNGTDCSDPNFLCEEMSNDIALFEEMSRRDPSKFLRIRYEDMALNTTEVARHLFKFLNVPFPRSLNRFLKSHTTARKSDDRDRYSTRRNSSSVAYSWRQRLTYDQVRLVQDSCYDVLDKLNYSIISSFEEFRGKENNSSSNGSSQVVDGETNKHKKVTTQTIQIKSKRNSFASSDEKKNISVRDRKHWFLRNSRNSHNKASITE